METYPVAEGFGAAFPDDVAEHPLLRPFLAWLGERPWGAVGYFEATPGNGDDLVPAEVNVDDDFAMVLRLPDGSLAGFWLAETRVIEEAPFVVFSSDGELEVAAPNFPCFLDRLASQDWSEYRASADFLVELPEEEDDAESAPDATDELRAWLDAQPEVIEFIRRTQKSAEELDEGPEGERAQRWLDEKIDASEQALDADPVRAAIAATLGEAGIRSDAFRVFAAGGGMVIRRGMAIIEGPDNKLQEIDETLEASLRPHLFAAREALARSKPGTGLWTSATVMVNRHVGVDINPSPDHALTIGNDAFPPENFAADQARFPRKASLMAPWLRELIDSANPG